MRYKYKKTYIFIFIVKNEKAIESLKNFFFTHPEKEYEYELKKKYFSLKMLLKHETNEEEIQNLVNNCDYFDNGFVLNFLNYVEGSGLSTKRKYMTMIFQRFFVNFVIAFK